MYVALTLLAGVSRSRLAKPWFSALQAHKCRLASGCNCIRVLCLIAFFFFLAKKKIFNFCNRGEKFQVISSKNIKLGFHLPFISSQSAPNLNLIRTS